MKWTRLDGSRFPRKWAPDKTATERGNALHTLSGMVKLMKHPYQRSPHSGSGNCWCGRSKSESLHEVLDGYHNLQMSEHSK